MGTSTHRRSGEAGFASTHAAHPSLRLVARAALGVGAIGVATAVLRAADADLTFAAITLLLAVVAVSVLGHIAGLSAALVAAASLTYYFTPPLHSFSIGRADDFLALVAFVTVSLVVGTVVARLSELRRRSELAAREAELRSAVINDLTAGTSTRDVLDVLARGVVDLFDLAGCSAATDTEQATVESTAPNLGTYETQAPGFRLRLEVTRPLTPGERTTIDALVAGVATALDRARLDREAWEQRVRADLDRSRVGFLTAVTHDLRTPLATIKTATGALLAANDRIDDTTRRELLGAAYQEAARLEGLVTNVLELTRIRTGALAPVPVATTPSDLVRAAVDRLGRLDDQRTITLDIDPSLPAVFVDALQLEIVLGNLLENAIRHDPTGSEIVVRARRAGDALLLSVVDHGPGIPAPDREHVFDEFVRLDRSSDAAGSGLGLAIVRALTAANGGTVRCCETPGSGSTFVLTLPIERAPTASPADEVQA